jgi:hypothetical protein
MARRVSSLVAAVWLLTGAGYAQQQNVQGPTSITVVDAGACATANACATFLMGGMASMAINVSGTFTGTLTFESTVDGAVWRVVSLVNVADYSVATTATAPGAFAVSNIGYHSVRVRATAFASGTAVVQARQGFVMVKRQGGVFGSAALAPDGTAGAPSYSFASEPTLGLYRSAAATITNTGAWVNNGVLSSGSTISGSAYRITSKLLVQAPTDGNVSLANTGNTTGSQLKVDALPTIASGFGTSPSVTAGSTPFAGAVVVGSGGVATSGVVNFNGTAFPSAPFCAVTASGGAGVLVAQGSTTQLTIASAAALAAGSIISWICVSAK